MAFDAYSGEVILFGGKDNNRNIVNETWAFSFDATTQTYSWKNVTPINSPPGVVGASMAYDASSKKIILFGGENNTYLNQTWALGFDSSTKTYIWEDISPTNSPPKRYAASMAYDIDNQQVVLFGGYNGNWLDDTWVLTFDPNTQTYNWINITPSIITSTTPLYSRDFAPMAYDTNSKQIVLFGGNSGTGPFLTDTWVLSFDQSMQTYAWINITPFYNQTLLNTPVPRAAANMIFDPISSQIILFGGDDDLNLALNDTWTLGTPQFLSSNEVTFTAGLPSSFTITALGYPTPSLTVLGVLPSGISFLDNGKGIATLSGTPANGSGGVYSLILMAQNNVTPNATQNFTLTVIPVPTTINLQVSPNPSPLGQPVSLSAVISPPSATGSITFFDGNVSLGTVAVNQGMASLTISSLSVGDHEIVAVYNGSSVYLASTSQPVSVTIETASPPKHLEGFQKAHPLSNEYINVLKWKVPSSGTPIVSYRIYRNQFPKNLIAEIPSNKPLRFKDRNIKRGKIYTYYVVSVDQFGNVSEPATVKIKPRRLEIKK